MSALPEQWQAAYTETKSGKQETGLLNETNFPNVTYFVQLIQRLVIPTLTKLPI